MNEQLRNNVNKIRRRLSLKFLLISYLGCSIFNVFFGKYIEFGVVFTVLISLIWVIKNTDLEYARFNKSNAERMHKEDIFVIRGIIDARAALLFIASFIGFLAIQQLIHPLSSFGAFLGLLSYMSVIMLAINGEYNPLALEKNFKKCSSNSNDEYIFSEHLENSIRAVDDTWYSDPCIPGNPIYISNK